MAFPTEPTDFENDDNYNIFLALKSIYDTLQLPPATDLTGQIVQNVKIYPPVPLPNFATLDAIPITLGDLSIGNYLFIPKSIQLQLIANGVSVTGRTLVLEKRSMGFLFPLLATYSNQVTPQLDGTTEKYNVLDGIDGNEFIFTSNAIVNHNLLLPKGFSLRYDGGSNTDFINVYMEGGVGIDAWDSSVAQPIVMIGDAIPIQ